MKGGKGVTIPRAQIHYGGAKSLRGTPNNCGERRKVATVSQIGFLQYSTCASERPGSNMGAPNLLLAPGTI